VVTLASPTSSAIQEPSSNGHARLSITSFAASSSLSTSNSLVTSAYQSPLAELLVYPAPTQTKGHVKSSTCVLTSVESIALLEEKKQKRLKKWKQSKERNKREK